MKADVPHQQTPAGKVEWFFFGYRRAPRETLLYVCKRLIWLGLWISAIRYAIAMAVGLCTGEGPRALVFLIPIGISIFLSLFFRFD